jgi:small conductance mechanosensitive channel
MLSALGHDLVLYALRVVIVAAAVFLAWQLAGLARRTTIGALDRAGIDQTISRFVANLTRVVLIALALLAAFGALGVETSGFSAAIAGASVAIGLAFRDTLANVAAGFMLLIFRPFRVGDIVNVGGVTGRVLELDLFLTRLDTADNRRLILPNGTVFRSNIENHTHHRLRRVDVTMLVTSTDPEKVREILESALRPVALPEPPPVAQLVRLAASSEWSVRFWCDGPSYDEVRHRGLAAAAAGLAAAGIAVA